MKHKLRSALFLFFSLFTFLQSSQTTAATLTLFVTQESGQEDTYVMSFLHEDECRFKLQEMAASLSSNPPFKIAYSTEEHFPFIENQWNEFLFNITAETSYDLDAEPQYVSSTSFSTLPVMQGWNSSIADPKPQTQEAEPFFNLRLTSKDKKNIELLISELADKTYLQLLANKASMNRKGDRAKIVHPMRFIGYILSELYLHKCLKTIEKDSIKFKQFINGFENHMEEEAAKENLLIYAPGFAELLQVDRQIIEDILVSKNYVDLVKKFL